jgi:hypothetical protein
VLQHQHDEWQDRRRPFRQQSLVRLLHPDGPPLITNLLTEGLVACLSDVARDPPISHPIGLDPLSRALLERGRPIQRRPVEARCIRSSDRQRAPKR